MWFYPTGTTRKKIAGIPIIKLDFSNEFTIVGRLAKHFKGGLSIPDQSRMTFKEIYFWYKIYEKQMAEEIIINDLAKRDKPMPAGNQLNKMVDKKIADWYKDLEEQ